MRSALVVGVAQQVERRLQFGFVPDVERPQQLLEGRPDAFDAAVHPGALRCDALILMPSQRRAKAMTQEVKIASLSALIFFGLP